MSDNLAAVIMTVLAYLYRIMCLAVGAYAAVNGVVWFAIVCVVAALLLSFHARIGEDSKK